ncbi:MAG: DsbE family thiol:disulfide interchange protein [Burkholderiales bacterium]|nr:DsbE family thiol:disulfide interchange protein [Burkholderiales bacterium]MDE1928257.1 DsbE family thiol:disulfide interchange protein [Burkholderiales bacterium]MDE2158451.1 DsbE family thiol:disulfide interchange protein [Burkholderiales bacterium]MDE2502768.1 DsbE family thiol:disulfide interchange protein [Burkholderiales bacterium]
MNRYVWPLLLFLVLAVFLALGLRLDPREVPSPLINKPAPPFKAELVEQPGKTMDNQDMLGKVWVLNAWASWCAPCREEHPLLVQFAKLGVVPIVGLNYKDTRAAANALLQSAGSPYVATLFDPSGRIGIDFGLTGVPETYVIDRQGIVRLKHIGPLTPEVITTEIEPMVRKLNG